MPPLFEMRGMWPRLKGVHIIRVSSVVLSYRTASLCVSPFCTVGFSIPSSDVLLLILDSVTWLSDFVRPNTKDETQITFHSFIHWFHTIVTKIHRAKTSFVETQFGWNWSLLFSFEMHHRKPRLNSMIISGIGGELRSLPSITINKAPNKPLCLTNVTWYACMSLQRFQAINSIDFCSKVQITWRNMARYSAAFSNPPTPVPTPLLALLGYSLDYFHGVHQHSPPSLPKHLTCNSDSVSQIKRKWTESDFCRY